MDDVIYRIKKCMFILIVFQDSKLVVQKQLDTNVQMNSELNLNSCFSPNYDVQYVVGRVQSLRNFGDKWIVGVDQLATYQQHLQLCKNQAALATQLASCSMLAEGIEWCNASCLMATHSSLWVSVELRISDLKYYQSLQYKLT